MARPLRIDFPGAIHHVMNRGINKQFIFREPLDRSVFLTTVSETVQLWKIRVHAYSLMDNHYHLLLETPLGNLSRAMRHLDGVYTQRFNRQWQRDGALMRGRFKSILVGEESYFLELVRYIHLNGVRALLYPEPRFDRNSSHQHYLNMTSCPSWLTTAHVLSLFPSVAAMDEFVKQGISEDVRKIVDGKKWPALWGSKAFIEKIKNDFIRTKPAEPEKPQEKPLRRIAAPRRILRAVMDVYGVSLRDIVSRPTTRKNEGRRAAIYFLRSAGHLTYAQIGRMMGMRAQSFISRLCAPRGEPVSEKWEKVLRQIEGKGKI